MWWDSWSQVIRVVLVGAAAYVALVVILRVSGKRTLAKLNAFDLVVTVALGSTLSSILLDSSIAWAEGVVGLALLVALQFAAALISTCVRGGQHALTSRASCLLRNGEIDQAMLRRHRITTEQLRQAVRSAGQGDTSPPSCSKPTALSASSLPHRLVTSPRSVVWPAWTRPLTLRCGPGPQ